MTLSVRRTLAAVTVGALLLGGCTSREDPAASDQMTMSDGSAAPGEPGAVDIGFAQDMAIHHEQALRMAELAQTRSTGPVSGMAATILESQAREIGVLRGWLQLWGAPQLPSGPPMTWMHDGMDMGATGTAMPGMATTAQLQRLESLQGRAFDVLFLELMIRHHRGGLPMADYAAQHASLAPVADVARQMVADQSMEISQMVGLLRALRPR